LNKLYYCNVTRNGINYFTKFCNLHSVTKVLTKIQIQCNRLWAKLREMRCCSHFVNSSHHLNQGKSEPWAVGEADIRGCSFPFSGRASFELPVENFPPPSPLTGLWCSRALAIYNPPNWIQHHALRSQFCCSCPTLLALRYTVAKERAK